MDFAEALRVLASIATLLGVVCAFGLWAMRAIIRSEVGPALEKLTKLDLRVDEHDRRIEHVETRVEKLASTVTPH